MAILPIGDLGLGNEFNDDNTASSLGRISGPLLKSNLERNGVDLAFETDLLYFDATNKRIGIRKDNPSFDLDVNSEIKSNKVVVTDEAIIDDILIRSPDIIGTVQGSLNLYATGDDVIFEHARLITNDLVFDQDHILSISNSDIIFDPNGMGEVNLLTRSNITGDLFVSGNITLTGDLSAADNIIVGNESIDTITLGAVFENDLIPAVNNLYSLGSSLLTWNQAYLENTKDVTTATIGPLILDEPSTIRSTSGGITVNVTGDDPTAVFERLENSSLIIDNNEILTKSNSNLVINPNSNGTIELQANTVISGNLFVTGNITLDGNLSTEGDITIGDEPFDSIIFNVFFDQSLIPGQNNQFDLGTNSIKWKNLYSDGFETITNINTLTVLVDDQMLVDGINNKISATQLDQDMFIIPDTGITYIEQTKWQDNEITNLLNTPITLSSLGIGYYNFSGDNGIVVPAGSTLERRSNPEQGETRWNTTQQYLECYDGTVWNSSIGPQGETDVTVDSIQDRNYIWNLILG
jgi:hypothetical protein